jgi:hypothetical protein
MTYVRTRVAAVEEHVIWPAIAGGLSAVVVFVFGLGVIKRRRVQSRRTQLRSRLFK